MEFFGWLVDSLFGKSLLTMLVAMLPVAELRVAIPFGAFAMKLDIWYSFVLSIIGNLIPVPFIILFVRRVFEWMQSKSKRLDKLVKKQIERTMRHEKLITRFEIIGLAIFVAIPLPGTGAWTGALLAVLLNIRLKYAFPAIAIGVVVAGLAVMLITHGFNAIIN